jgi:hypothetical protein
MGCNEYNWENELMKITKCEEENKVLNFKVTNRATGPKLATYDDNENVSGV